MESFAEKLRSSRDSLSREGQALLGAGRRFGEAVQEEALGWRSYVRDRATSAVGEVRMIPARFEARVLTGATERLDRVERALEERLRLLGDGVAEVSGPPIEDYESLTARDIVAKLEELPPEAVQAVLAFERAHKGRTTVLRAASEKLAA